MNTLTLRAGAAPGRPSGKGMYRLAAFGAVLCSALATGCAFKASTVTINTPAVYNVAPDAAGVLRTNLVSAGAVETRVTKERLWLPQDYAVVHNTVVYGVDIVAADPSTTTPRVRLGFGEDSWRWIPTSTNVLHAAPITSSGSIRQTGVPFAVSGLQTFTAGDVQVVHDMTNQTQRASSIIPGVPAEMKGAELLSK